MWIVMLFHVAVKMSCAPANTVAILAVTMQSWHIFCLSEL